MINKDKFYSTVEAGKLLGVTQEAIKKRIYKKELKSYQEGENRSHRILGRDLIDFAIRHGYKVEVEKAKVISVANQKGGSAKTTTAVSLAAGLAINDRKVLLIDADPQGNASVSLFQNKTVFESPITMLEVLLDEDFDPNRAINHTHVCNLDTIFAKPTLAEAEVRLPGIMAGELALREKIPFLDDKYDFILIDCPPSLGYLTVNALCASDFVIIPIESEYYALVGTAELINTIKRVKRKLNSKLEILGVLITKFDRRNSIDNEVKDEIMENLGDLVFSTVIPDLTVLTQAPANKKTIFEHAPKSAASTAYMRIVKELITNLG